MISKILNDTHFSVGEFSMIMWGNFRLTNTARIVTKTLQGVHPRVVSEQLGHANIGITLDTYSHVIPGLRKPQ